MLDYIIYNMKTIKLNVENTNIFFTSDPHFNHENIIKYCSRPFTSVEEMNKTMKDNWNRVIGKDDIVFITGDFLFRGGKGAWVHMLNTLNGIKYLVQGNHDRHGNIPTNMFEKVSPMMNILIMGDEEIPEGQRISLCHYPMISWYQSHRGAWQLYGHVHGGFSNKSNSKTTPNQLDVGVDVHNFTPITYQEVKTIITKQNLKL